MVMVGEEKYFMAYVLFDLNFRGKICFVFCSHLTERLMNSAIVCHLQGVREITF